MTRKHLYSQAPEEQYANAFAMHLLMPDCYVAAMEQLGYSTERMASEFRVDVEVMALRRQMFAEKGAALAPENARPE